jgi:hypothetical protein
VLRSTGTRNRVRSIAGTIEARQAASLVGAKQVAAASRQITAWMRLQHDGSLKSYGNAARL